MKTGRLVALGIALMVFAIGSAMAHGVRGSVGVYVGPGWGPWWYPPPVYYPVPVIVRPEPPPVYIERADSEPEVQHYWYYCKSGKGYYPYVKECPEGWQKVLPQPER